MDFLWTRVRLIATTPPLKTENRLTFPCWICWWHRVKSFQHCSIELLTPILPLFCKKYGGEVRRSLHITAYSRQNGWTILKMSTTGIQEKIWPCGIWRTLLMTIATGISSLFSYRGWLKNWLNSEEKETDGQLELTENSMRSSQQRPLMLLAV